MGKGRHSSPARRMKPMILVFCEGDTEDVYVNLLKIQYRIPMKIVSKITGQRISPELIMRHIKNERLNGNDAIHSFLLYDLDVSGIAEKIQRYQRTAFIPDYRSLYPELEKRAGMGRL